MTYKTFRGHLGTMYWSVNVTLTTVSGEKNLLFTGTRPYSCPSSTLFCGQKSSLCWETKEVHACVNILLYLLFQWEAQAYS